MSRFEVETALDIVPPDAAHRLMAGYLMSDKTLAGQTNKWPGRYPPKETIPDILVNDPRVLNLIHYNTHQPETLCKQLQEITELAGPNLDGFQLNMAWPLVSQLWDYRWANSDKFIVLQIGGRAMAQAGSAYHFAEWVRKYLAVIDAILIDPSGGKGEPFVAERAAEYLRAIQHFKIGLGVAGGLGPRTLDLIGPLVKEFGCRLNIDAEGRLRTPQPEDKLSLDAMLGYLSGAFLMFKHLP